MEIPHTVTARPDTGLYNAKLGIWLFLASEVMLFGGLFSAYVFLRLGAEPGYWPMGLLNVPVGTFNTAVLILSSVTIVMAWAALKMRQFSKYKFYMLLTILCGSLFLIIKVAYEYPEKFHHFGAFIRKDALGEYEQFLGNQYLAGKGRAPRVEISGHLLDAPANSPYKAAAEKNAKHFEHELHESGGDHNTLIRTDDPNDYVIQMDAANADPTSEANEKPHFLPKKKSMKTAVVKSEHVDHASMFVPKHSSYFSVYFMITGLHGLHVLGGVIVFIYFWGPGAKLYQRNPEHLANRIECAGLFWHFVDLVWIFAFPIFYLL
jgi:cytochrome c oxidase subunit 3